MPAWHASGRCTKLARGAAKCISFTTTPFTLKSFPPVTINVGTSRRSNRSNTSIAVCLWPVTSMRLYDPPCRRFMCL